MPAAQPPHITAHVLPLQKLRSIRDSSRAEVRVEKQVQNCTERLVVCASSEPVESEWCGAAEALMMCGDRVVADKVGAMKGTIRFWTVFTHLLNLTGYF